MAKIMAKIRKLKRPAPVIGIMLACMTIGIVVGAVLFSNQIEQSINVIDYEDALTIVLVNGLGAGTFREVLQDCSFNITKNVADGLPSYTWNVLVDHAEALVIADLSIGVYCYTEYLGTVTYYETAMISTRNFGDGNGHHYVMALPAHGYSWFVMHVTFHNGAPAGSYGISIWIDDFTA